MKIAFISDIHGNLEALKEGIKDIESRNIDSIICLGDFVGYGPYPNEVVDIIKKNHILSIIGNYDEAVLEEKFDYIRSNETNRICMPWASKQLSVQSKSYLDSLPKQIVLEFENKKVRIVHGSTRAINEYLKENSTQAEEVMSELNEDILVCGHTHIPYIKQYNSKFLINDGSIGKPKIGKPNGTYFILNIEKENVDGEIVEFTYDYKKTVRAMEKKCIPQLCIRNIKSGIE